MIGLGTIVNTGGIIIGGLAGSLFGRMLNKERQDSLISACGVAVLFIGIGGAMQQMLSISDGRLSSGYSMMISLCLALGTLIGELLNIEHHVERFGEWLKQKTGNAKDAGFVNAFVTASLTVCVGAMAIVGAMQDGMSGDWSILATKSVLDAIIIIVMSCSMGKGCVFSCIPVFIVEGLFTVFAVFLSPLLTELAMDYLSMLGSILIFSVGINLLWPGKIHVANMLPALLLGVAAAYLV